MFGYIKPYRPELKVKELEEYEAVYCGLCKELGSVFGIFARFTLSYDFAFMAAFLTSIDKNACPEMEKCACIAHPIKKPCRCKANEAISISAAAAMILVYYKLKDNIKDKGFLKKVAALLFLPFAKATRKKALLSSEKAVIIDNAAMEMMRKQSETEAESCALSDKAAEPTAKFLEETLAVSGKEFADERILRRFGYLLGRYIYLCDALDDIDDDRKKGNYNPFILGGGNEIQSAKSALFLTTAEIGNDLALFELCNYKGIVENIIYVGLRAEAERIIKARGGKPGGEKSV